MGTQREHAASSADSAGRLPAELRQALLDWYDSHARDLPWRVPEREGGRPDPYHVWISEIMLQQTRVEAVKKYYRRFLERLPGVRELAVAPEDELMKLWQGLGYYNRARNLQRAAGVIMECYGGEFPREYQTLLELPGIGEYTAGAIASIAFGECVPAVDGNVYRVYTRLFEDDSDITKAAFKKRIRKDIGAVMPQDRPGSFNQAWMDLGACVCLPNGEPLCGQCPLGEWCLAGKHGNARFYPVKPEKKRRAQQEKTVLLLEYQGKYLIRKRPSKGLLAGLWEFPVQDGKLSPEELARLLEQWGIRVEEIELLGRGGHVFSHVEWHMLGYLVHLSGLPLFRERFLEGESVQREGISQEQAQSMPGGIEAESVWTTPQDMEKYYSIPSAFADYYKKLF